MEDINEVSPPGFGHTKSGKGDKKGGTAAAFDRARKEGRFKGSKSDMFAIMWAQKNKGDKPHYKPGTDEKYKKYRKEEVEMAEEKLDIKKAIKRPGAFTKKAKSHDMEVQQFANYVKDNPDKFDTRTKRQASFAKTLKKVANEESKYAPKPLMNFLYECEEAEDRGTDWSIE